MRTNGPGGGGVDAVSELVAQTEMTIEIDYGQVYIYGQFPDEPLIPCGLSPEEQSALVDAYRSKRHVGVADGVIDLLAPVQWHWDAPMEVQVWTTEPTLDDLDSWDHMVEVDLDVPDGQLHSRDPVVANRSPARSPQAATELGYPGAATTRPPATSRAARTTGSSSGPDPPRKHPYCAGPGPGSPTAGNGHRGWRACGGLPRGGLAQGADQRVMLLGTQATDPAAVGDVRIRQHGGGLRGAVSRDRQHQGADLGLGHDGVVLALRQNLGHRQLAGLHLVEQLLAQAVRSRDGGQ